jgi:lipopolysaccharide transport system ATP-binding protein
MTGYVIRVEGLCKEYVIGAHEKGHRTFRESIADAITTPLRRLRALGGEPPPEQRFWALQDVSFDVKPGEVVGIIGSNGAGKSTLLKILSRITVPTRGRAEIRGRVASLLDVGTGFHPELTGQENIYLNGAILGMTRAEIRRKFDEIVAFAEVEKFLDTPVKRYSSGMYVRLAFAVAAHLEPEILMVDEILAVGDAAFQKKCLGKMGDVARGGRTVLFVTHNMHAVEKLCHRVVCLKRGRLAGVHEDVREGIVSYFNEGGEGTTGNVWSNGSGEVDNDYFVPERLEVSSASPEARPEEPFSNEHPIVITLAGVILREDPALNVGLAVYTEDGEPLFWTFTGDTEEQYWPQLTKGHVRLRTQLPAHFLNEGDYRVQLAADLRNRRWLQEPGFGDAAVCVKFSIRGGLSNSSMWTRRRPGNLAPVLVWERC